MKMISVVLLLCAVAGCSNRMAFDTIQSSNRYQCSELPPSQYEDCIDRVSKTFEEYENEREKVLQ